LKRFAFLETPFLMFVLPPYDEIARLVALSSSLIVTVGSYDQVWKIWRTRSVRDIAPSLIYLSGLNEVTWLNYGFAIHEWPMILVGIINFPACVLAIWGYIKYREKRPPKTPILEKEGATGNVPTLEKPLEVE